MKPYILFILILFVGPASSAQENTTLTGHIDNPKGDKVYLRHYSDYLTYGEITVDSGVINKQGDFTMTFDWKEPGPITFYHGFELTELYLCPGDDLHLYLDAGQFDETLTYTGKGAELNTYCAQEMLSPFIKYPAVYRLSEEAFSAYIDSIREVKLGRLENVKSTAGLLSGCLPGFLDFQRAEIDYDWAYNKLQYPLMNRYYSDDKSGAPVLQMDYSFLQEIKVDNPAAMGSAKYVLFLEKYIDHEVRKLLPYVNEEDEIELKEKYIAGHFKGPVLEYALANLIYEQLTMQNDTLTAYPAFRRYKESFPAGKYVRILDEVVETISLLSAGNAAPDFSATDTSGKAFTLHDFKGKLVYLDIWATWCGPCVGEIPSMEKLITKFEGEEVVFLSVSIDDDKERWRKFIADKKLRGVQLHSPGGFDSSIAKQYAVAGIPHYVLINEEGIIIDSRADRPGDIRDTLSALLD